MAAAAVSPSVIDLKSQATLPIRLGASILESSPKDGSRFMSVRYNHKPSLQQSGSAEATVKESGEFGLSNLLLECKDGKYTYSGRHGRDDDSYVLLSRGQGKDKELVLERLHSSHALNLTRTPSEDDASVLAARHAHIPDDVAEQDDLFGEDDEEEPADETNPFDYRHFLKAELEKPETTNPSLDATRSAAGTPITQQQRPSTTPLRKPAKPAAKVQPPKKRKPAAAAKANPKRAKAGEEESAAPPAAKPKADVPKVRLDRKASLRRSSMVDDSGELILEDETPVTEKPPKHNAMSLALSGQLAEGPISLMSAASTPGEGASSHVHEPAEEVMETYEFELGDSSPEHEEDNGDLVLEEEKEEEAVDAEPDGEGDDEDVDPMELPSPAQGRSRPSVSATATGVAGGEDDDDEDLDRQLALAFAEDGEGSEESEEE